MITPIINPLDDWDNMPLNHARIGYENLLTATTTTDAAKMLVPNTYERYEPASGSTVTKFQLDSDGEIDYVGIAAHNLATHNGGEDILIQYATTVGGALTDLAYVKPSDNSAIMVLFDPVTVAEIAITTNSTAGLELGVIYAGKALQMYQPIYGGYAPINLSGRTEYQFNKSDTGQFLGQNITLEGTESPIQWRHLDPDWYRERFEPFVIAKRTAPFFIKWQPDRYPDEVAYCHSDVDIRPQNMGGGHDLMSVSFNMWGHSDIRSN